MPDGHRREIGKLGEDLASTYLQKQGFTLIDRNFTTHWGELDIVAHKDRKIYFVEVRTKIGGSKGKPYESITYRKLQNLKRSINLYLLKKDYKTYKLCLSVISIQLNADKSVDTIKFFENVDF